MAERLTYRNQYGEVDLFGVESSILREGLETEKEVNALTAALNKLTAYEDAEEQGRLVTLPISVGSAVYRIKEGRIQKRSVNVIHISAFGLAFYCDLWSEECFHVADIGKTVFFTIESAEAALQEWEATYV